MPDGEALRKLYQCLKQREQNKLAMKKTVIILVAIAFFTGSCSGQTTKTEGKSEMVVASVDSVEYIWENKEKTDTKTIHVFG